MANEAMDDVIVTVDEKGGDGSSVAVGTGSAANAVQRGKEKSRNGGGSAELSTAPKKNSEKKTAENCVSEKGGKRGGKVARSDGSGEDDEEEQTSLGGRSCCEQSDSGKEKDRWEAKKTESGDLEGTGDNRKRPPAGEEGGKRSVNKAQEGKEQTGKDGLWGTIEAMAARENRTPQDLIEQLMKMKNQREMATLKEEFFQDELSCDVGTYNLCEEVDDDYDTATKIKRKWTVYQRLGEKLKNYLEVVCFGKFNDRSGVKRSSNPEMPAYMKAFMDSMAQIYVVRDDPDQVRALCGKVYKWRLDTRVDMPHSDIALDPMTIGMVHGEHLHVQCQKQIRNSMPDSEDYCAIPKGMKLVMELFSAKTSTKKAHFDDWVYIARSSFAEGHLGLFAARQFDCGTPIGIYIGRTLHRYKVPGGKHPSQERLNDDLAKSDVKYETYTMVVRDRECRLKIVEADPLPKWQKKGAKAEFVPMFMGMQFANDCLLPYRKDSTLWDKAGRETNIVVEEDGMFIAKKRINPGDEIYLDYQDDWRKGGQHTEDGKKSCKKSCNKLVGEGKQKAPPKRRKNVAEKKTRRKSVGQEENNSTSDEKSAIEGEEKAPKRRKTSASKKATGKPGDKKAT